MCKFCENSSSHQIFDYDNTEERPIRYGQYSGVGIYSSLRMQGNMLLLDSEGSYRSEADCYYETAGVEVDDKLSESCKPSIIKINYCPFCGNKINSTEYEKESLTRELSSIKLDISCLKRLQSYSKLMYSIDYLYEKDSININKEQPCGYIITVFVPKTRDLKEMIKEKDLYELEVSCYSYNSFSKTKKSDTQYIDIFYDDGLSEIKFSEYIKEPSTASMRTGFKNESGETIEKIQKFGHLVSAKTSEIDKILEQLNLNEKKFNSLKNLIAKNINAVDAELKKLNDKKKNIELSLKSLRN